MNCDSIPPFDRARRCRCGRTSRPRQGGQRVLVLGPLGLAVTATAAGAEQSFIAALWLSALAWTVLASLALALLAGLRRGDWSAFRDREHREDREEEMDLDLRVGAYAFLREREQEFLADGNDPLH